MPAGVFSAPVVGFGSGKFGTPWVRMQRDTARSFCISCGLTCWRGALCGAYCAQARVAAWNVGEEPSMFVIREISPLAALMEADDPKDAESGKFNTPCERMHVANSTRLSPDDEPPVFAVATRTAVVVVLRPATPAFGEPPPQAAATRARPTTAGITRNTRRRTGPPLTPVLVPTRQRRFVSFP